MTYSPNLFLRASIALLLILVQPAYGQEKFVNIGGHQCFVSIKGKNDSGFTVIFESGAGGTSKDWEKTIALLPAGIRTITYDRAGSGKSEPGPLPRTMAQAVFELHALLNKTGINGPVILVGQSIGGLLVRLYTKAYGRKVAGLVLVDPAHEDGVLGSLKYGGWTRLRERATGVQVPKPQLKRNISPGYDSTADYMAEEFHEMYLYSEQHRQPLGHRPLVVLCAGIRNQPPGTPDGQWKELRAERDKQVMSLSDLSSNSISIVDVLSSHAIQNDNPAAVAKSVLLVIQSLHSKTSLHDKKLL